MKKVIMNIILKTIYFWVHKAVLLKKLQSAQRLPTIKSKVPKKVNFSSCPGKTKVSNLWHLGVVRAEPWYIFLRRN